MKLVAISLCFLFCCSLTYDGPFRSWHSVNVSVPYSTREINALYEESFDPNCVWLIGNRVFCYNLTTNTMVNYDTFSVSNAYVYGKPGAVIINGIVYYMTQDGALYKYDISNKQLTFKFTFSRLTRPCLVKHPNNTLLYTLGADSSGASNQFYIYDLKTDTSYTGNNLIYSRLSQSCVVHDYNTDYPFLYVFGGDTVFIEKIELSDSILTNSWILVDNSFSRSNVVNADDTAWDWDSGKFRHGAIISFLNYIYIWNAWDGHSSSAAMGAMFSFDSETNTFKYITNYPLTVCCSGFTYVTLNSRIYTFGGYDDYSTFTNNVYKSNKAILPTNPPSIMPTTMPSILPCHVPSMIPSTMTSGMPWPSSMTIAPTTTQESHVQGWNDSNWDDGNVVTVVLIIVIGAVLSICCIVIGHVLKNNKSCNCNNNKESGESGTNMEGIILILSSEAIEVELGESQDGTNDGNETNDNIVCK